MRGGGLGRLRYVLLARFALRSAISASTVIPCSAAMLFSFSMRCLGIFAFDVLLLLIFMSHVSVASHK